MSTLSPNISKSTTIGGAVFQNRIIRSSIGGRMAYYNGEVNEVWRHFEARFAEGGVGGIISATMTVNPSRWSPLEYPRISDDRFIDRLRIGVQHIQNNLDCNYIMQLGDPGYHTQTSLLSEQADGLGPSGGFDLLYGYRNFNEQMTKGKIDETINNFKMAAGRVNKIGCAGVEVTASKGYLIHQFLNPGINRRKDKYGGTLENRFRLLKEVIFKVREELDPDKILGVRLSAADHNNTPPFPVNIRYPFHGHFLGNELEDYVKVAGWLSELTDGHGRKCVDYIHVSNGFGFPNPRETPGAFPVDMVRRFFSSTRHFGIKARFRSILANVTPKRLLAIGWNQKSGVNLEAAVAMKKKVGDLPVIVNGGFQDHGLIEDALTKCDFVSMARPLLKNPDLPKVLMKGKSISRDRRCDFCNRCAVATTIYPIGCYNEEKFPSEEEMQREIELWNTPPQLAQGKVFADTPHSGTGLKPPAELEDLHPAD